MNFTGQLRGDQVKGLKLFAALGPGDIVGAQRARIAGNAVNETSIAFSEQFISYANLAASGRWQFLRMAVSIGLRTGIIEIENRIPGIRC